jgi:hypothetical protein
MQSIALDTTPKIKSFYQDYSPTLNGIYPITSKTFSKGDWLFEISYLEKFVNKFNTSSLLSCVLNPVCKLAEGCTAVCLGDSHVLTFKSDLDENQDRRLSIMAHNALDCQFQMSLMLSTNNKWNGHTFKSNIKNLFLGD